jgi:hypothetical protein
MTEERKVIVVEIILILEINTGYLSTSHYPVSLKRQASTCQDTERRKIKRHLIPWNRFLGSLKVLKYRLSLCLVTVER